MSLWVTFVVAAVMALVYLPSVGDRCAPNGINVATSWECRHVYFTGD